LSDGTIVVDIRGELDLVSTATLRDDVSAEVIAMRSPGVVVDCQPTWGWSRSWTAPP
jgi:anti-anti-sigma regulatory factor